MVAIPGVERSAEHGAQVLDLRHRAAPYADRVVPPAGSLDTGRYAVLDQLADAVLVLDAASLRIRFANAAALRRLAFPADGASGTPLWALTPGTDATRWTRRLRPLSEGAVCRVEVRCDVLTRSGSVRPVEARVDAPRPGGPPELVVTVMDGGDVAADEQANRLRLERVTRRDERDRVAAQLRETVIHDLFATGLTLQTMAARSDGERRQELAAAVEQIDAVIRAARAAVFPGGKGPVG